MFNCTWSTRFCYQSSRFNWIL